MTKDLSKREREALVWVRDQLRAGNLQHESVDGPDGPDGPRFSMNKLLRSYAADGDRPCGTVGCIAGWAWLHMNRDRLGDPIKIGTVLAYRDRRSAEDWAEETYDERRWLYDLFYPDQALTRYPDILPEQAAQAIDNVLKRREAAWDTILERREVEDEEMAE